MRYIITFILLIVSCCLVGCTSMVQPDKVVSRLTQTRVQADVAIAQTLMQQQHYTQSEAQLHRALMVAPQSISANLALADLYQLTKQQQQASQLYHQLLQRQPDNQLVQWRYGQFLCLHGDSIAGLELLQRVAQVQTVAEPAQLQLDIAQCAVQTKDFQLGAHAYQQVLQLDPGNAVAYLPYAHLLLDQHQFNQAEHVVQLYWRIKPENEASLRLAVMIARMQGKKTNQALYQLRLNSFLYDKKSS